MKNFNKQKLPIMVAVLGLVFLTAGITYALFKYIGTGSTENTITSDSLTFLYEEKDAQGNGINITDASPVSDAVGMQGQAFNFEISAKSADKFEIPYEISVRKKDGSDNLDDIVKLYLTKVDGTGNETQVALGTYSSFTTVQHNGHNEKKLTDQTVPQSTSNYIQRYKLRMWIDANADFSSGTYNDKSFSVTVNVYSQGRKVNGGNSNQNSLALSQAILDMSELHPTQTNGTHYETIYTGPANTELVLIPESQSATVQIGKTDSTYQNLIAMTQKTGVVPIASTPSLTSNFHIKLSNGENYFKGVVTSADGNTSTEYTFRITYNGDTSPNNRLANMILADNPVNNSDPVVNMNNSYDDDYNLDGSHNGLYASSLTDSGETTYFYFGTVTNNYVRYAGKLWRAVRINEDGTIRLILDERIDSTDYVINNGSYTKAYNSLATQYDFDENDRSDPDYVTKYNSIYNTLHPYTYYTTGEAPLAFNDSGYVDEPIVNDALETWYQTNIASNNNYSRWIAHKSGNYFCESFNFRPDYEKYGYASGYTVIGAEQVYVNTEHVHNNATFTCPKDAYNHQYVDSNVGLLAINDYLNATGDSSFFGSDGHVLCYLDKNYYWWLSNSAGVTPFNSLAIEHWGASGEDMVPTSAFVDYSQAIRPVVNLRASTTATKDAGVYVVD